MKILLINPPDLGRSYGKISKYVPPTAPPLGLLYIASFLEKNNYDVSVLDAYAENLNLSQTLKRIIDFKPDIIGFTAVTITFPIVKTLAKMIKKNIDCTIAVGGPHSSACQKEISKDKNIDFVIQGEGEKNFLEIIQGKDISEGFIENLDEIPFPAWHLIDLSKYHHALFESYAYPLTSIITSRGCPYNCIFCASKIIFGKKTRFRSIDNVMQEIDMLKEGYGINGLEFRDDTLFLSKERTLELCEKIKEKNMIWIGNIRADVVCRLGLETLKKMKISGCRLIEVGCESGNQNILNELKKGITIEQIKQAFFLINWAKIDTLAFFIYGSYGETKKTMEKTLQLAKDIKPTFVEFFILNPHPGTEAYNIFIKKKLLDKQVYASMESPSFKSIIKHPNLTNKELEDMIKKSYRSFYFRLGYIWSIIKKIRSLHQLKVYLRMGFAVLGLSK